MIMYSMPGFLRAMRNARVQRPDLPATVWRAAAQTERPEFSRLRVSASFITRWAEFYAYVPHAALR